MTVKLGGKTLSPGKDYTVTYKDNTNIGTASVTITGINGYIGKVTRYFGITPKKGGPYIVQAYKYNIMDNGQAAFTGLKNAKATKVTIPKTVTIGGKSFRVTTIAKNALKKSKVSSVTIGSNIKTIENSAFEGCGKLTKVTIGSKVTKIGSSAFKNCKKLRTVTIKSKNIKSVGKKAFQKIAPNAKIKVPARKLKAYKKLFKGKGQGKKVKITK